MRNFFNDFKKTVLISNESHEESEDQIIESKNRFSIRAGSILITAINLFQLLYAIITKNTSPYILFLYSGIILMLTISITIALITYVDKICNNIKLWRLCMLLYYIFFIIGVMLIDYYTYSSGISSNVTLCSLMLFMIMVVPLARIEDSICIIFLMMSESIMFLFLDITPPWTSFFLIKFSLIIGYFYIRNMMMDIANETYNKNRAIDRALIQSFVDSNTATLNRNAMFEYIKVLNQNSTNFGVIIFDIDNFHNFNDTHSNEMGDETLYKIALKINTSMLEKEKFIFRCGGDEFCVFVEDATDEEIIEYCKRYESILSSSPDITGRLTASFGLSNSLKVSSNLDEAERMLSLTKIKGKNGFSIHAKYTSFENLYI